MPFLNPGHSFEEEQILYQAPTLVSLLRQRAMMQPNRLAYTFLADGANVDL
jgi:hypothetical protein